MDLRNAGKWFSNLFTQSATDLAWQDAVRAIAAAQDLHRSTRATPRQAGSGDGCPGKDQHHAAAGYRLCFASYLHQGRQVCSANEIPEHFRLRAFAVYAIDASGALLGSEVIDGGDLEAAIARQFAQPSVSHLRICSAPRGCYVARAERA